MNFDSVVGVLALSIGLGGIVIGILFTGKPERRKCVVEILAACGVALVLFGVYFVISYLNHESQISRIRGEILSAVENRPLSMEQIRDIVALADDTIANGDIVEAIEQLRAEKLLHSKRADWQDVNARQFYTRIYE